MMYDKMKDIRERKRGRVNITGDGGSGGSRYNITSSSDRSTASNLVSSGSVSGSLNNISDTLSNINRSISFRSERYEAIEKNISKKDSSSQEELRDQNLRDREEQDEENREQQQQDRREREANKEKKKKNSKIKLPIPSMPRTGIFDAIKSFIVNVLFGRFLIKMLEFAPMLKGLLGLLAPVAKFIYSVGKKILDAGATFIDFGFKAYDFTRGIVGKLTGDLGLGIFDKLSSTLTTFLNLAIVTVLAASAAASSQNNQQGIDTIRGIGPGRAKRGAVAVDAARRYASRFGKDAAIQRFGSDAVKSLGGKYARSSITNFSRNAAVKVLGKRGAAKSIKAAAGILKPLVKNIPLIGGITEFVLSLISGDPVGKAAFKGIGAGLGTWIGGALGTLIPVPGVGTAIGMFLGGTGGSLLGSAIYDMITGKKGPSRIRTRTRARSRGGEVSDDTPEIESKKYITPIRKPKSDGFENEVADRISQVEYFGPIVEATSKMINVDNEDDDDKKNYILENSDYRKIEDGLALMLKDFNMVSDKKLHEIYTTGMLESLVKKEFDKKKPLEKKKKNKGRRRGGGVNNRDGDESSNGMSDDNSKDPVSDVHVSSLGSGGGSLKDMSDQDFSDLAFIVSHEALRGTNDEYAVAAAVLNRVADPRYPNTIMGVGTAPGQFEAVFSGKAYRDEDLAKQLKDNQGKIIDALKKLDGRTDFKAFSSMGQFMGDSDIRFATMGNFYHYAEQQAKSDPIPSNIPKDWQKLLGEPVALEKGGIIASDKMNNMANDISQYASYESGSEGSLTVVIPGSNTTIINKTSQVAASIGSGGSREDSYEFLEFIG